MALYDRQLRVLSREAMEKITKAEVLIVGLTGLGVEFGKYYMLLLVAPTKSNSNMISQKHNPCWS